MKNRRRMWVGGIVAAFIIFAYVTGILRYAGNTAASAILPVQSFFYKIGKTLGQIAESEPGKLELIAENEKLKNDIKEIKLKLSEFNENETELQELRGLFNFSQRLDKKLLLATIVGERNLSSARTIVLDRGSQDGVKKDYPVVNQDGIMVGKIFEVKDKSSLVLILLDRRSRVAVTIQNRDRTIGLLEGGHGLSSSMKFIPQAESVEVGNLVITSGLEEAVPRGLLIGTVESITKDVREPFQEATIKPLVDFKKLITVAVILPES